MPTRHIALIMLGLTPHVALAELSATSSVDSYLDESVTEEEEVELGEHLILVSYSLVALIVIAIWAEQRHIPSSVAAMIVGSALGLVMRLAGADAAPSISTIHALLFFNEEIFLYFLLPPIIFEAGFSVSRTHFFHNLATILLFAVVGTLATTFVLGCLAQKAGVAGWFRAGAADALDFSTARDSFTFGALISATDPVATLSIMGSFNVEPLMYTLVAGESVLNDAVAIVLVRILDDLVCAARKPTQLLLSCSRSCPHARPRSPLHSSLRVEAEAMCAMRGTHPWPCIRRVPLRQVAQCMPCAMRRVPRCKPAIV